MLAQQIRRKTHTITAAEAAHNKGPRQ